MLHPFRHRCRNKRLSFVHPAPTPPPPHSSFVSERWRHKFGSCVDMRREHASQASREGDRGVGFPETLKMFWGFRACGGGIPLIRTLPVIFHLVLRSFAKSPPLSFRGGTTKNLGGDSLWMTMLRSFADLRREQATRPTEKETLSFPNKINSAFCIIVPFLFAKNVNNVKSTVN